MFFIDCLDMTRKHPVVFNLGIRCPPGYFGTLSPETLIYFAQPTHCCSRSCNASSKSARSWENSCQRNRDKWQVGSDVELKKLQTWTVGILVSHFTGIQTILGSERPPDRAHEFNKFHFWPRTRLGLPTCAACPWGLRSGCNFFACLAPRKVSNLISLLFNAQIIPNPLRKHLTEDSHHLLRRFKILKV